MMKVPITAVGGPFDGQIFELEEPYFLIPDCSCDAPGWVTRDTEPSVSGQRYYVVETPTTMTWRENSQTP